LPPSQLWHGPLHSDTQHTPSTEQCFDEQSEPCLQGAPSAEPVAVWPPVPDPPTPPAPPPAVAPPDPPGPAPWPPDPPWLDVVVDVPLAPPPAPPPAPPFDPPACGAPVDAPPAAEVPAPLSKLAPHATESSAAAHIPKAATRMARRYHAPSSRRFSGDPAAAA
jgi:hypothetical protein